MSIEADAAARPCRILSLDGGGAKGFYTIGVLKEVEALLGGLPLCDRFDLIFGTSTGAIIAALLALGHRVDDIHKLYRDHVPKIMKRWLPRERTKELNRLANEVFGETKFTDVKTRVGIVATHWLMQRPMIFKGDKFQAHGMQASFVPGFGCTIADAVKASCSAYPYFKRAIIKTRENAEHGQGIEQEVEVFDGGYCANNPTLYAIADAVKPLGKRHEDLRILSIGVGVYPSPKKWISPMVIASWLATTVFAGFKGTELLQKTLDVNTTSMEQLRKILFGDIKAVRIDERFEQPEMATDLLESDLKKLSLLYQRGRQSYAAEENAIKALLI
ncbi:MAG TPA: patatin-like phospholipase family protein [Terriglobales bacterium]|jgi:predicted acylesterase/phospholipase RssA